MLFLVGSLKNKLWFIWSGTFRPRLMRFLTHTRTHMHTQTQQSPRRRLHSLTIASTAPAWALCCPRRGHSGAKRVAHQRPRWRLVQIRWPFPLCSAAFCKAISLARHFRYAIRVLRPRRIWRRACRCTLHRRWPPSRARIPVRVLDVDARVASLRLLRIFWRLVRCRAQEVLAATVRYMWQVREREL